MNGERSETPFALLRIAASVIRVGCGVHPIQMRV
jgi:hypothetical protein